MLFVCSFADDRRLRESLTDAMNSVVSHNESPRVPLGLKPCSRAVMDRIPPQMYMFSRGEDIPLCGSLYRSGGRVLLAVPCVDLDHSHSQRWFDLNESGWRAAAPSDPPPALAEGSFRHLLRACDDIAAPQPVKASMSRLRAASDARCRLVTGAPNT